MCVGTVYECVHARGGLRLSLVFSWITVCVAAQPLNPELTDLANPSYLVQVDHQPSSLSFYGVLGLSDFHACAARTLHTTISSAPKQFLLG